MATREEMIAAYCAFGAADKAFQEACVAQFGKKNAGDARYYPKRFDAATTNAYNAFLRAGDEYRRLFLKY